MPTKEYLDYCEKIAKGKADAITKTPTDKLINAALLQIISRSQHYGLVDDDLAIEIGKRMAEKK